MAKFIRHDFGAIHEALKKLIIAEVKTALMELPGREIKGGGLCSIVVSDTYNYHPEGASVTKAWLDDNGKLCVIADVSGISGLYLEDNTEWVDITDFGYLIDQIAQTVGEDKTVYIVNKRIAACEIAPEFDLGTAIHRTI